VRILIFGGSFDPPHAGHQALLAAAVRRLRPAKTLVIPAWQAPLKGRPTASAADRLAMAKLAFPKAAIDASEARSGRQVYTVETLRRLKRAHPGAELHFLTGSDAAASFERWKEPRALRMLAAWWTARRPGAGAGIPPFFQLLSDKMPDVSSTDVRRLKDVRLPPAVAAYVEKKGLYHRSLMRALQAGLKPSRYAHTLAVAALAAELARRWGLDEEKARLAGLLHDAGRMLPIPKLIAAARSAPLYAETARRDPILLHAYASESLARRRFGVKDADVLSAVRRHTLGEAPMKPLDRLLYVADACSEDRRYVGASELRRLAFNDLEAAFRACVAQKLKHAVGDGRWLHPATVELWNSLDGK
jgi:nicotinate-nucleotide adenylyltransferase